MKQSVTVGAQLLWSSRYSCNNGRYGCTIVMSYIEINKAVSQWLLTFNLCVAATWPLTCAFHIPCMHTPEIIDMHRGMCDKSIYSTPRCRCPAQTYTPEPRCHTSYTGGLVWAVRLWISCRGATMCSKCHACMPVCKMYNPCTIHLTPQPCGKPPRSGSAVLLDKNDLVCFSILQK